MSASKDDKAKRAKGRPSLEEAAEIDRAILDAALEVLLRHGEAATLNEVAKTAGLSRKSVYARYPGKSELFVSAMRHSLQGVGPVQFDDTGSFADRLVKYLASVARMVTGPNAMRFQRVLSINPDYIADLKPQLHDASRKIIFEPLVALLETANWRGEIAPFDVEKVATFITFAAMSPRFSSDLNSEPWPTEEMINAHANLLADLLMRGLLPR